MCAIIRHHKNDSTKIKYREDSDIIIIIIIIIIRIYYGAAQPVLSSALQYNSAIVDNYPWLRNK